MVKTWVFVRLSNTVWNLLSHIAVSANYSLSISCESGGTDMLLFNKCSCLHWQCAAMTHDAADVLPLLCRLCWDCVSWCDMTDNRLTWDQSFIQYLSTVLLNCICNSVCVSVCFIDPIFDCWLLIAVFSREHLFSYSSVTCLSSFLVSKGKTVLMVFFSLFRMVLMLLLLLLKWKKLIHIYCHQKGIYNAATMKNYGRRLIHSSAVNGYVLF